MHNYVVKQCSEFKLLNYAHAQELFGTVEKLVESRGTRNYHTIKSKANHQPLIVIL